MDEWCTFLRLVLQRRNAHSQNWHNLAFHCTCQRTPQTFDELAQCIRFQPHVLRVQWRGTAGGHAKANWFAFGSCHRPYLGKLPLLFHMDEWCTFLRLVLQRRNAHSQNWHNLAFHCTCQRTPQTFDKLAQCIRFQQRALHMQLHCINDVDARPLVPRQQSKMSQQWRQLRVVQWSSFLKLLTQDCDKWIFVCKFCCGMCMLCFCCFVFDVLFCFVLFVLFGKNSNKQINFNHVYATFGSVTYVRTSWFVSILASNYGRAPSHSN